MLDKRLTVLTNGFASDFTEGSEADKEGNAMETMGLLSIRSFQSGSAIHQQERLLLLFPPAADLIVPCPGVK